MCVCVCVGASQVGKPPPHLQGKQDPLFTFSLTLRICPHLFKFGSFSLPFPHKNVDRFQNTGSFPFPPPLSALSTSLLFDHTTPHSFCLCLSCFLPFSIDRVQVHRDLSSYSNVNSLSSTPATCFYCLGFAAFHPTSNILINSPIKLTFICFVFC